MLLLQFFFLIYAWNLLSVNPRPAWQIFVEALHSLYNVSTTSVVQCAYKHDHLQCSHSLRFPESLCYLWYTPSNRTKLTFNIIIIFTFICNVHLIHSKDINIKIMTAISKPQYEQCMRIRHSQSLLTQTELTLSSPSECSFPPNTLRTRSMIDADWCLMRVRSNANSLTEITRFFCTTQRRIASTIPSHWW